ncbi:Spx/MgsR family RNA polymerase-binding regulatory protein [Parasulfitobacter algicola]|uniref:Spx/MgsR family RNA polymerase-binding regulatory protein n=1 Tax=Parasulfitobacter algicola TaxID=2614809 RepID=A0ABX2J1T1_9RHOB|nr:Spx/MgsR family RNA polymerase-binding regulatory protein [Sulfitobacter algicola]NSX57023.1 Spx/MgsR family RNA polymerase-binding regulatory protein [Sulfitobacter algicola]
MSVTVYGMPSCDTVKKGTDWLEAQGEPYERIDFPKVDGLEDRLKTWIDKAGLTNVLNTRAIVFKKLPAEEQARLKEDADAAAAAMAKNPYLIKRPLLVADTAVVLGFRADTWEAALK